MRRFQALVRRPLLVMGLLVALAALLGGCNTVAGIGEDITSASQTTEEYFFHR